MKKRVKNILILSGLFFLFAAPSISFDALFPAYIKFPDHIKTIAVIDRSAREGKLLNVLEGGITGEGIGQDKAAARKAIDGLLDQVSDNINISFVKTGLELTANSKPGNMAFVLPVDKLKGICIDCWL